MKNKEIIKEEIGKRVKDIRENKMHMNKVQFSDLIGMKNQYLGAVETGKRGLTVEKTIEICKQTGVSCDYLLRGTENSLAAQAEKVLEKYSKYEIEKAFDLMKELMVFMK